jgi:hypothetical protein
MMFSTRKYRLLLLVVLVTSGCLTFPDYARGEGPENSGFAGTDSESTIAFFLAVSGRPQGVLPIPVTDIKAAVSSQLTTTLSEQGFTVIPEGKVLSIMREWRVRDGKSIPRGFLDSLADSLGAQLLVVADLVIQPDRLVMTARYVDAGSAILLKLNMAEQIIGQLHHKASVEKAENWLVAAGEAGRIVGDARLEKSNAGREPMLILDTQPVGCSASVALMASHALLDYYVEHSDWALIDPAVINSALHDAGHSEKYLGADARALLRTTFACTRLMIPRFISYAPARVTYGTLVEYDETPDEVEPAISDFAMSLRLVDLASGSIIAGKEVFLAVPDKVGWFGIPKNDTLMTRLKVAAGQLWSDMHNAVEEF